MPRLWLITLLLLVPLAKAAPPSERSDDQRQLEGVAADYQAADGHLQQTYAEVVRRTPPARRAAVEHVQALWLADRLPRCERATRGFAGESMQRLQRLSCLKSITTLRADDLKRQLPAPR